MLMMDLNARPSGEGGALVAEPHIRTDHQTFWLSGLIFFMLLEF